ncbi:hypothetical protein J4198_005317 [Salmonella enterica]|nr:hypothetical protein [Salmonella enterica]
MKLIAITKIESRTDSAEIGDSLSDQIRNILKNRKKREVSNLEEEAYSLYVTKIFVDQSQPQCLKHKGERTLKEKQISMHGNSSNSELSGNTVEVRPERKLTTPEIAKTGAQGERILKEKQISMHGNSSNSELSGNTVEVRPERKLTTPEIAKTGAKNRLQPLDRPLSINSLSVMQSKMTLREWEEPLLNERSIPGTAVVMQVRPLTERAVKTTKSRPGTLTKKTDQNTLFEGNAKAATIKYYFKRWGGNHYTTVKENIIGNTLFPSNEYVRDRLEKALKEKGNSALTLEDKDSEHAPLHKGKEDGDEDD